LLKQLNKRSDCLQQKRIFMLTVSKPFFEQNRPPPKDKMPKLKKMLIIENPCKKA
jgi:hypothetical protein